MLPITENLSGCIVFLFYLNITGKTKKRHTAGTPRPADMPAVHSSTGICSPVKRLVKSTCASTASPESALSSSARRGLPVLNAKISTASPPSASSAVPRYFKSSSSPLPVSIICPGNWFNSLQNGGKVVIIKPERTC